MIQSLDRMIDAGTSPCDQLVAFDAVRRRFARHARAEQAVFRSLLRGHSVRALDNIADAGDREHVEQEAILDTYLQALGMI